VAIHLNIRFTSNNTCYIAYQDRVDGENNGGILVQEYDGSFWSPSYYVEIDTYDVYFVSLEIDANDTIYLVYGIYNTDISSSEIIVMQYDGSWTDISPVDYPGYTSGGNYTAMDKTTNTLYLNYNSMGWDIVTMQYYGDTWSQVGESYPVTPAYSTPEIKVINGQLSVVMEEVILSMSPGNGVNSRPFLLILQHMKQVRDSRSFAIWIQ
jgi:hypothetical protein